MSQPTFRDPPDSRTRTILVVGPRFLPLAFGYLFNDDACFASDACRDIIYPPSDNARADSTLWVIRPGVRRDPIPAGSPAQYGAVEIVASGAPWPSGEGGSVQHPTPDSLASNITAGIGFLGGVLTKTVWIEDCVLPYPSPSGTYYKLSYDSTTATLRGRAGSAAASVTLRELEPPAGEQPRTRFGKPDATGAYVIGAIRPGRHELTIQTSLCSLTDTLRFTAGQHLSYSANAGSCR